MTAKRFSTDNGSNEDVCLVDNVTGNEYESNFDDIVDLLNRMDNDLLNYRAENTKLKLILKDVIADLKRMNTKAFAEHIEKICNLDFKGDVE